ncbi:sulfur oxidation c-type cytochrome SoxX [Litorivicinus sp.]|nr:sulfur oxidation c-type cytochrome SoxX [Litorivicinus sp.]MDC1207797.1 sulfur oxidation c-type cytochrome SoxX [Litorivicinus sp.]MDC1239723.1 sulfur oxidation c-type cytochrome SoxX [Litorivicinus sp.]
MKKQLLTAILATALIAPLAIADAVDDGKSIAWSRKKGNCLTCHLVEGGQQVGNTGPPLVQMKARFPNKADLRAQIWDPTKRNPMTNMPPFGRNHILTEKEIDLVVEYLYSL